MEAKFYSQKVGGGKGVWPWQGKVQIMGISLSYIQQNVGYNHKCGLIIRRKKEQMKVLKVLKSWEELIFFKRIVQ